MILKKGLGSIGSVLDSGIEGCQKTGRAKVEYWKDENEAYSRIKLSEFGYERSIRLIGSILTFFSFFLVAKNKYQ